MEWNEYLSRLLLTENDMKNLSISLDGGLTFTAIPPIVKASIVMLDKIIEHQGNRNVLVFPEKTETFFLFALMKLYHNIVQGKIKSNYDPTGFHPGEKLKVGNAVVEYLGTETKGNKLYMMIRLADWDRISAPAEYFPIFQRAETNRRLSKNALFNAEKRKALDAAKKKYGDNETLRYVTAMKTHMESSVFVMTSIASIKEQIVKCMINQAKASDVFYFAQTDYKGEIANISPGQMSGFPAMIFSPDLYGIDAALLNNSPVQSIFIDGSNMNQLTGQLDVLDRLLELNVPVTCITDIANSFDLDQLQDRGFNVWRWSSNNIPQKLYESKKLASEQKAGNCANHIVNYVRAESQEISTAMQDLACHRKETEQQSPKVMRLYEKLSNLVFSALRAVVDFSNSQLELAKKTLEECQKILNEESLYLDPQTVSDYQSAINNLTIVYCQDYLLEKVEELKRYLGKCDSKNVYLIIPDNGNKSLIQEYWDDWCLPHYHNTTVTVKVLFPSEYYSIQPRDNDVTVVCGWLKRAVMRKILFGFNTRQYIVLLYEYENKWKRYDSRRWSRVMQNSSNRIIIERSLSYDELIVPPVSNETEPSIIDEGDIVDELAEIELVLRENKFKQYISKGSRGGNEIVPAVPISFVGGYVAFYRTGHKMISATKIISSISDKIEQKLPAELNVGDFIVVREADKDIIRDLADIALRNSGKEGLRAEAIKWREALKIELLFCSVEELYNKLKAAGCNKEFATVKRWIDDEDIIAPQSKEDLKTLAKVTENEMLAEKLDEIYIAAQEVRSAHVLAGRKLSEQLKLTLAQELREYGTIDPFNFWEPIDINVEGIGSVKVLKIIDIGSEVDVDPTDTNRLIEE